jgi:hypothetical protein
VLLAGESTESWIGAAQREQQKQHKTQALECQGPASSELEANIQERQESCAGVPARLLDFGRTAAYDAIEYFHGIESTLKLRWLNAAKTQSLKKKNKPY